MRLLISGSVSLVASQAVRYPDLLGHITTPRNNNSPVSIAATGLPWAVGNGCFGEFEPTRFERLLERVAALPGPSRPLFVVCPDVVGDARQTLALWPWWSLAIRARNLPVAFVLQDGQEREPLPDADAYFVGGTTRWKLGSHAARLVSEIKQRGRWLHMGRVTTLRRLQAAFDLRCDSVDGSNWSSRGDKFLLWGLGFLARLHQQPTLFESLA